MSSNVVESNAKRGSLALATSGVFLVLIFALPLVQLVSEIWSLPTAWPTAFRLLPALPRVLAAAGKPNASVYQRVLAANQQLCEEFRSYEVQVTESAWPIKGPRTWLQAGLTGPLRSGNEQVVVGPGGWLYFRPDIEALIRPGFLEPQRVRPGFATGTRHANPLPAIRRFAADLKARGIELLVVPIPSKAARLGVKQGGAASIHNASFQQFVTELERSQISVCDLTSLMPDEADAAAHPRYLKSDSHWTPAEMQLAAQRIALQWRTGTGLSRDDPVTYETKNLMVENVGDTGRLLGGDSASDIIAPESCEITQIKNHDHSDWSPDPSAEILLLGDSFTNIYSQA